MSFYFIKHITTKDIGSDYRVKRVEEQNAQDQVGRSERHRNINSFAVADVIGLIDGTLVPILTPTEDGFQYMSRKGYSCLNVCVICDAVGRILYVNCGFPGSVHDSTVWRNSTPGRMFANGDYIHGYCLLGDSGYANGEGIMTPFRPSSVREDYRKKRYNRKHSHIRCHVEMTISRLKARFPILNTNMRLFPEFAVKVILACAVLHNTGYCIGAWSGQRLGRTRATMAHPPAHERDLRNYVMQHL
ncbi:transposase, IS4 family [Ancylostoma duodenale]|uniref:Transposase, IS4 family n=1 Tax=Ancylostoma duodenale TaxID=51022 RepID=A0A0C2H6G5_9BILA|nr:transposase, IS4 family [Ancylostoma duodenale]